MGDDPVLEAMPLVELAVTFAVTIEEALVMAVLDEVVDDILVDFEVESIDEVADNNDDDDDERPDNREQICVEMFCVDKASAVEQLLTIQGVATFDTVSLFTPHTHAASVGPQPTLTAADDKHVNPQAGS